MLPYFVDPWNKCVKTLWPKLKIFNSLYVPGFGPWLTSALAIKWPFAKLFPFRSVSSNLLTRGYTVWLELNYRDFTEICLCCSGYDKVKFISSLIFPDRCYQPLTFYPSSVHRCLNNKPLTQLCSWIRICYRERMS